MAPSATMLVIYHQVLCQSYLAKEALVPELADAVLAHNFHHLHTVHHVLALNFLATTLLVVYHSVRLHHFHHNLAQEDHF